MTKEAVTRAIEKLRKEMQLTNDPCKEYSIDIMLNCLFDLQNEMSELNIEYI